MRRCLETAQQLPPAHCCSRHRQKRWPQFLKLKQKTPTDRTRSDDLRHILTNAAGSVNLLEILVTYKFLSFVSGLTNSIMSGELAIFYKKPSQFSVFVNKVELRTVTVMYRPQLTI